MTRRTSTHARFPFGALATYVRLPVWAAALWLSASGCYTDTLMLTVRSPRDLNSGRPVRMLVRAVDHQEYVNESYQSVADRVVVKDESVLDSAVIYPSTSVAMRIKKPSSKAVGLYFFFTTPGPSWKRLLQAPLPFGAEVELGQNNIESVTER